MGDTQSSLVNVKDEAAATTVDTLIYLLVEAVKDLCEAEAASLLLYDPEHDDLYFDVAIGEASHQVKRVRLKRGVGIAGHVLQSMSPLLVPDVAVDERFSPEADNISGFVTNSIVAVPLWDDQDGPIGVIEAVNHREKGQFSSRELGWLVEMSHPISSSVASAQRVRRGVPSATTDFYNGLVKIMALRSTLLHQANEELWQARRKFEREQAKLFVEEKLSGLSRLVAGLAHEVNNPLAFVRSNLSSMRSYIDDIDRFVVEVTQHCQDSQEESAKRFMTAVSELELWENVRECHDIVDETMVGIERVVRIAQQLHRFADVDRDQIDDVDLNESMERVIGCLDPNLTSNVQVELVKGEIPVVRGMRRRLDEVILELVENALRAVEANKGQVVLTTNDLGDRVQLSVADNGYGMSTKEQSHVFDPFYSNKSRHWRSTGLGLSAAYGIVTAHGGKLFVQSSPDNGSTFTLRLPVKGPIEQSKMGSKATMNALSYYEDMA